MDKWTSEMTCGQAENLSKVKDYKQWLLKKSGSQ